MSRHLTHIRQRHQPADKTASLIVRNIRKDMIKVRQIWLDQIQNLNGDKENDPEALHNFRVEIRRLRVWLHQTRDQIRTQSQARLQLKRWAKDTNTDRDLEVMLDLLHQANIEIDSSLPDIYMIHNNKKLEYHAFSQPLALKPRTRTQRGKKTSFAIWLAERLSNELEKTRPLLNGEDDALHKARIHIKHMRYLVESVASCGLATAQPALAQLKAMQTKLGDLHDLFVLRQRLPGLLCDQLNHRLTKRLQQQDSLTQGIQQDFTATRNQFTLYLRWQSTRYKAAMTDWNLFSSQSCLQLEGTLNDLINELKKA